MENKKLIGILGAATLLFATFVIIKAGIENAKQNDEYLDGDSTGDSELYAKSDHYEDLTECDVDEQTVALPIVDRDTDLVEEISDTHVENTFMNDTETDFTNDADELIKPVEAPIIIGDGEAEISRSSKAYEEIITEAYEDSRDDESFTLTMFGKVYGLGARGVKVEHTVKNSKGEEVEGREYDTKAIEKLFLAMQESKKS